MKIQISGQQMTKFKKGQPFQLSRDQIQGQPKKGKQHEVEIDDAHMKRIQSAAKRGKGYRISGEGLFKSAGEKLGVSKSVGDGIEGGSFLKSVKNTASKVGKTIKKTAYDVNLGKNIEAVKDAIPESLVKTTIKTALEAQGMSPEEADAIASAGTAGVYGYSFDKKATKKNISGAVMDGVEAGIKSGLKSSVSGGAMLADIYNTGKGNSKLTLDTMKNPIYKKPKVPSSGGMLSSQVMMSQSKPVSMGRSKASMVRDALVADANTSKGGSFKPTGGSMIAMGGSFKPTGGSMIAMGGSFKPTGGSFKPLGEGVKPQKGSQEMKDRMAKLRAMRNKNKD
jgi:hypothetical protein